MDSGIGDQDRVLAKARVVSSMPLTPLPASAGSYTVVMITNAVRVQITTVSMNGSSRATKPSLTGAAVRAAAWAMAAEPKPASLENTARRKPRIITPKAPPATPWGEKAPFQMAATAPGSASAFSAMMVSALNT